MKSLRSLPPADQHRLTAAEGWLELGDCVSASDELDAIATELQEHRDVLQMRLRIYLEAKKWNLVVSVAETLVAMLPNDPDGWIHRSYALHELKRTQEAFDQLRPVLDRFPAMWIVPYNLACYLCQLSRVPEARPLLERALQLAPSPECKQQALEDPDLAPLWTDQKHQ